VCLKSKNFVKTYTFDRVYPPDSTQEEIYSNSISPIVNETLKGFNCTIFAYGQTGTGKTYTMEGHGNYTLDSAVELSPHAGIIPRAAHEIFDYLEKNCQEFTVRVSFLELYNEELVDLLGTTMEPLKIFDDYTRKGVTVYNLEEVPVANINDVAKALEKGLKKRQTAETNLNKTSR
jgi:kinesin family protein 11